MNAFTTIAAGAQAPDPSKRVRYSFGLVLGVDEFVQEQTYFLEKHRSHQRLLHGSGTVWGLKVTVPPDVDPPEVRVAPGAAIVPAGIDVCVPLQMCARLNDWLASNLADLTKRLGPPPFMLSICVVLCHRECETDVVPLPGEPCRSEEDAMAPSRVADTFEIRLCVDDAATFASLPDAGAPADACACPVHGAEAGGVLELGRLLRRLEVTSSAATYATAEELAAEVRALPTLDPWSESLPPSGPTLFLHPDDARALVQHMARVWVTEVLPELLRRDARATCGPAGDRCVLLGRLHVGVNAVGVVDGGAAAVVVDETDRPILLSTALLQEWVLSGGPVEGA